jgi:hypothetical protein
VNWKAFVKTGKPLSQLTIEDKEIEIHVLILVYQVRKRFGVGGGNAWCWLLT